MTNPRNKNAASQEGSASDVAGGQAKATKQVRPLDCGLHHINKFVREIQQAGLQLRSSAGDTQLSTLPKVLAYLGSRGANTYELVALGYLRAATRIKELEDQYVIIALSEDVIGPDGLFHKRIARYVLIGKRKDMPPPQGQLDLEAA